MSNIPLRRTTRVTRNLKDNENANARPSRVATRAKTLATTATDVLTSHAAAPTLASKAKTGGSVLDPIGKKRRNVLVEVTGLVNKNKGGPGKGSGSGTTKGKEKEVEEAVESKPKVAARPMRESLRAAAVLVAKKGTRAASISTTSSQATDVIAGKEKPSRVLARDGPVFVKPPAPAPVPVVKRKPSVRDTEDAETDRAFKRRHTEDLADELHIDEESQADADKIARELVAVDQTAGDVQLWDDLDAEDWDDPAMVSEYVAEVCVYLKEIELTTRPNPDYMQNHPELDWEKRGILVDWILQVHARFQLLQETLFLFTNILDRFLSARPISLSKLQLVGITCFFIAAKYEETYAPSVAEIAYLADGQYTVEEVLKAERYILKTIDWDLRYPGPMGWLRRGSKADDCETKARTVAKYLLEIGCLEWRLVGTLPSLMAAAALWLARLVLGREEWTPNLAHYMTYTETELLPTANIMLNYILEPVQHESLYKKYAHKRYLKCSVFMRQWALERWPEGSIADLGEDLLDIKADIQELRANSVEC